MKKNKIVQDVSIHPLRKIFRTMRLIMLLILLGITQVHAGQVNSGALKITLKLNNSTIEKALFQIEKKTDLVFIYNKDLIDVNRNINLNIEDKGIDEQKLRNKIA